MTAVVMTSSNVPAMIKASFELNKPPPLPVMALPVMALPVMALVAGTAEEEEPLPPVAATEPMGFPDGATCMCVMHLLSLILSQ